ncbi:MAG TPA: hypothetical protein VF610_02580, partial [Segetibacter sp.]
EEGAAMSRNVDEEMGQFLADIDTEESPFSDNFEQVVLDSLSPVAAEETTAFSEEMAGASRQTNELTETFLADVESGKKEQIIEKAGIDTSEVENVVVTESNGRLTVKEELPEPDEHERMFQNIKAMLEASGDDTEAGEKNAIVPIDPYYTIDYFASQGIKLEFEQNPQDQLGKNLKKFTQWLRHMKKLGPEDATEVIIKNETEADIVKSADSSNTAREIVTEAMASVLERQGKKDKALELYKKLSFLNPGKSAYFAHKIKNLNGT